MRGSEVNQKPLLNTLRLLCGIITFSSSSATQAVYNFRLDTLDYTLMSESLKCVFHPKTSISSHEDKHIITSNKWPQLNSFNLHCLDHTEAWLELKLWFDRGTKEFFSPFSSWDCGSSVRWQELIVLQYNTRDVILSSRDKVLLVCSALKPESSSWPTICESVYHLQRKSPPMVVVLFFIWPYYVIYIFLWSTFLTLFR